MKSTISISVRSLLLAMALVVGVVGAYVVGAAGRGGAAQAATRAATQAATQAATGSATAADQPARTITMTGSGDATGVPDELSFQLSVGSSADDVSTAMDQASGKMKQAVAALRKDGVGKQDTQTTGLSIDPTYRYENNQPPVLTGYRVRQSIDVTVRSLRSAGKALGAAVAAGGNSARVSGLKLKIGDVDGLLSRARDQAVVEATAKAKQYAAATGQSLGDVVTLREVSATPPAQALSNAFGMADARVPDFKAVPIEAGSQKLDVQISVVWELK